MTGVLIIGEETQTHIQREEGHVKTEAEIRRQGMPRITGDKESLLDQTLVTVL